MKADHGKQYRCIFILTDAEPEVIIITFDSENHNTPYGQAWTLAVALFGDAVINVSVSPKRQVVSTPAGIHVQAMRS
jgi:hypothetical protein